jgi:D-alanine-D-alanine ligase
MKRNIMVVFGGNSTEHDISVITAVEALHVMPIKGYNVLPVYIREGKWYTGSRLYDIKNYIEFAEKGMCEVRLIGNTLYKKGLGRKYTELAEIDCALLATHGGDGENGSLQGLLECSGVPYTSPDVRVSALCMDKHLTKLAVNALGIDTVDGREVLLPHCPEIIREIEEEFLYPLMVKPSSQGSSIGLTFAKNRGQLEEGLILAKYFGPRALVEKGLTDFVELNVAVATINGKIVVSDVERPISSNDFLTYGDKYLNGGKGMNDLKREFPADIPSSLAEDIKDKAETIYKHLGMSGVVRMDFMKTDKAYLNEINTIPGSLAHYLFPNLSYTEFLRGLIDTAIARGAGRRVDFKTDVLRQLKGAIKK